MAETDWMWCYENPKDAAKKIDELQKALRIFIGCAYPVSTEISPRGHSWRNEEALDYALSEAKTALET